MDNIWYRNPSKSEVIGRCGGDDKTEWPRRTDKKSNAIIVCFFKNWLHLNEYIVILYTCKVPFLKWLKNISTWLCFIIFCYLRLDALFQLTVQPFNVSSDPIYITMGTIPHRLTPLITLEGHIHQDSLSKQSRDLETLSHGRPHVSKQISKPAYKVLTSTIQSMTL